MSNSYFVVQTTSNLRTEDPDRISWSVESMEGGGIEGTFDSLQEANDYVTSVGGTLDLIS